MAFRSIRFGAVLTQLACVFALIAACTGAPGAAPTSEPPMDASTMNQRIGRAVNLGNALEAPNLRAYVRRTSTSMPSRGLERKY